MSLNEISRACEAAPRSLDVILQHLAARARAVSLAHRARPDAAGYATDDGVLGVHAVREEERQVRREVVDLHAACEVVLHDGEAVCQGERELRDRVRACFGDVIARDRHRVEVAHFLVGEELLDVAHHSERELRGEDAGVLGLILLEDVRLHRAAHGLQRLGADALVHFAFNELVARHAQQREAGAIVAGGQIAAVARRRDASAAQLRDESLRSSPSLPATVLAP